MSRRGDPHAKAQRHTSAGQMGLYGILCQQSQHSSPARQAGRMANLQVQKPNGTYKNVSVPLGKRDLLRAKNVPLFRRAARNESQGQRLRSFWVRRYRGNKTRPRLGSLAVSDALEHVSLPWRSRITTAPTWFGPICGRHTETTACCGGSSTATPTNQCAGFRFRPSALPKKGKTMPYRSLHADISTPA
jgi:hypothetical protein